jgi:hypothetical protein
MVKAVEGNNPFTVRIIQNPQTQNAVLLILKADGTCS